MDLEQRVRELLSACVARQLVRRSVLPQQRPCRERCLLRRALERLPLVEEELQLSIALLQLPKRAPEDAPPSPFVVAQR